MTPRDLRIGLVFRVEMMENGNWVKAGPAGLLYASEANAKLRGLTEQRRMGRIVVPHDQRVDRTNLHEIVRGIADDLKADYYTRPKGPHQTEGGYDNDGLRKGD